MRKKKFTNFAKKERKRERPTFLWRRSWRGTLSLSSSLTSLLPLALSITLPLFHSLSLSHTHSHTLSLWRLNLWMVETVEKSWKRNLQLFFYSHKYWDSIDMGKAVRSKPKFEFHSFVLLFFNINSFFLFFSCLLFQIVFG